MKLVFEFVKALRSKISLFWVGVFVVLMFWWLVIVHAPVLHIRDFWWTPIRALIHARLNCIGPIDCVYGFAQYTVHNDSVKLFPAIFELIHTSIFGYWSMSVSRFIGAGCFLLTLIIFVKAHKKLFPAPNLLSKALYLYWLFVFTMYIGVERFSAPFAIHRSLPALCAVSSAYLLWVPLSPRLKKLRLYLLGILSVISLFSFANGALLFLLVIVTLLFRKSRHSLWLSGLAGISFALYMSIVDFSHSARLSQNASPSLSKGLSFFLEFSIWPVVKVFENVPYAALLGSLLVIILIGLYLKFIKRVNRWNPELESDDLNNALGFYSCDLAKRI